MFHGLFPGLTSDILAVVNRALPSAAMGEGQSRHLGKESETFVTKSPATALGRRAADELNQWAEKSGRPAPLIRPA